MLLYRSGWLLYMFYQSLLVGMLSQTMDLGTVRIKMANVKTYNLSIHLKGNRTLTFRGISRVAVERYRKHYEIQMDYLSASIEAR